MLQGLAYFEKQVHGDVLLAAHLVDVLGRAVHLPRQPSGGTPLPGQLSLDEPAHVKVNILVRFLSHMNATKLGQFLFCHFFGIPTCFTRKTELFYHFSTTIGSVSRT